MKIFGITQRAFLGLLGAASLCSISALGQGTDDYVLGQWEFNGDLSAEVGEALEFLGTTSEATKFVNMQINGETAEVMEFPAATAEQGYRMFHGAPANGGGVNVNVYTLIMDIMYPAGGTWRALLQTSENTDDAELFIAPWDAIGTDVEADGVIVSNMWHRVAFVFNLTNGTLAKYINAEHVGTQQLGSNLDQRFSLPESVLLFTDNDGDTASGFINSLQFRDYAMTEEEVIALGLASAAGITSPGVAVPAEFNVSISRNGENVVIEVDEPGTYRLVRASAVNGEYVAEGAFSSTGSFTYPIGEAPAFFMVERQ